MKQLNQQKEFPWSETFSKTIQVEMTVGELINIAASLGDTTYSNVIRKTEAIFDASPEFYKNIPNCCSTYSDCIEIIKNNIPVIKKKSEV